MTCLQCGNLVTEDRCECGWKPQVGGKIVLAPWRSFTCTCCDYDFAFRSFQECTKTVCSRCQRRANVMCRTCQAVEVES
jgi:hypothetical protein